MLLNSKKLLKNSATLLRSKLSKLTRSKAVKSAANHFTIIFRWHRARSFSRHHYQHCKVCSTWEVHRSRNFAPVFVDELYVQPIPVHLELLDAAVDEKEAVKPIEKCASMPTDRRRVLNGTASSSSSSSAAAACSVSSPVHGEVGEMNDVDLRAEMFIRKFKEEMKLQRQRSLEECQ